MTETAAEALEVALWLHRAPARRVALLDRPLPDGIGQLLRVAGGSRDQVAAAALITGESEETVLEAVRFYLQQILFHEHADAYRVLALRPGAPQEQAREHYRLLQHWLHPDRRGADEWDSVYAGRVNRAWTQLRTPEARAAYDTRMGASPAAASDPAFRGPAADGLAVAAQRLPKPVPRKSRNLALVIIVGCVGLLVALAMQREVPPEWRDASAPAADGRTPVAAGAAPAGEALLAAVGALAPDAPPAPPPAARQSALAAPIPGSPRLSERKTPTAVTDAGPPGPLGRAPSGSARTPGVPAPAALAAGSEPAPATVAEVVASPVARTSDRSVAPADPAAVAASAAPRAAARPLPDPLARMAEAKRRAGEVLAYLGNRSAVQPPVWNDLAAARQAERLQVALLERLPSGGELALREPKWKLSPDGARLVSGYRARVTGGRDENGRIALDFIWREDRLLVQSVSLEPDR